MLTSTQIRDPSVRYPGSKNTAGTAQWLTALMPTHATYVAAFAGKDACARWKVPSLSTVLIDRDPAVIEWWRRRGYPGAEFRVGCGNRYLVDRCLAHDWDGDELVYIDPPYPHAVRTKHKIYRWEMSDGQHDMLLDTVRHLPCRVMISSYISPRYEAALADWWRDERQVMTRGGVLRTEVVWCNFTPGGVGRERHPKYPGRDFRERERIKKKVRRWRANFSRLPEYERDVILAELIEAERDVILAELIEAEREAFNAKTPGREGAKEGNMISDDDVVHDEEEPTCQNCGKFIGDSSEFGCDQCDPRVRALEHLDFK